MEQLREFYTKNNISRETLIHIKQNKNKRKINF